MSVTDYTKTKLDQLFTALTTAINGKVSTPTTGTASATTYLRGDGTWATAPTGTTVTAVLNSDGTYDLTIG